MRRLRRKGGNNEKVFGCHLLDHLATSCQEIPQVLRSCSEFIEKHGVVDGIYRLSGVSSNTQKLRGEFDSEGTPDLNKDVYLQDIHCVSSLCKAYFRELPNPLLTYQLYDKYAEAVAIQLEDERLVKIKDVLKELPAPHYRTLEFLMRHLVKMASYSSHTNMHARNLAIVWAPNLLRSKDIEASGFNGTAAFMEVRVQSIVVEFILTHVPQLFPGSGIGLECLKSFPSPSIHNPEKRLFPAIPLQLGNINPGDGPPAMRSYHAIIDGTDKRKGSLKSRKWKSIFNLGGRLQDPRGRNKNSTKEKERTVLRPAKSMDSLSSMPYSHEGSRQRAPSTVISPLAQPSPCPQGGADGGASTNASDVGSGYAVTFRRGQGASVSVVSGGGGTKGTYSRLGSNCNGGNSTEALQPPSRSPGISSKADRRAGIHISGPFSVTVPLHITSGLAFGVLQGGGAERRNHSRGEGSRDKGEGGEGVRQEGGEGERHIRVAVVGEDVTDGVKRRDQEVSEERRDMDDKVEGKEDRGKDEELNGDCVSKPSEERGEEGEGGGEDKVNHENDEEEDEEGEHMDSVQTALDAPNGVRNEAVATDVPYPTTMEEDNAQVQDCPLDFQDTFGFLDLMDSSASTKMFQAFSVEPPHAEDEYEDEVEQTSPGLSHDKPDSVTQPPVDTQTQIQTGCQTETHTLRQTQTPTHRPLSFDQYGRANMSMSLPYISRPFLPARCSSSEEEDNDDEDADYDREDEEDDDDMFCKSLPSSLVFNRLTWSGPQTDMENGLSLLAKPSQQLDSASDDRSIGIGLSQSSEARMPPGHLDIDSPDYCNPSEEVLRHSKAKEENRLEAIDLLEDTRQDPDNQEKDQTDTLTNTCTESTEIQECCHSVETSMMKEEETPGDIERGLASASSSTDCEEASLQTTAEEVDTGVHLQLRDEEDLKSHCGEGVISEGYNGDTVSEAEKEDSQEHLLTACRIVSCAEEPKNILNERSEVVSAGGAMEQPENSAERDSEGKKEDVEEEMEEREDRNGGEFNKQEGEVTRIETEEREVLKELEETEGEDFGAREQKGMIEEVERIAGEEGEVGEEDIYEIMNVLARDDMMESGDRKDREGETEERKVMEEVIETKEGDSIRVQQKEIDKEGESRTSEEMSAKEETKREVEGVDTMGETEEEAAEEGMENMLINNEEHKQDLEAQHFLERRDRAIDLMKDVVGEGDKEMEVGGVIRDEEGDSIHVVQQETEERESTGPNKENQERENEGETKDQLQIPTIIEESEEELKEVQIYIKELNEGQKEGRGSKVGSEKGVGRVLVRSKQKTPPKVFQARSVPMVPPKPHHCRITALNLRQEQQTERREADRARGKGKVHRALGQQDKDKERKMEGEPEHDKVCETEQQWNEKGEDEGRG
ncbi:rho GTPase-activating protein 30-like isoform X2 [Oncorhynchus kisutch]|uniref:rho GTPase-activating protein 30-like isoform X2 n=1 Tax=Oncorhynchus kisutch TaxID=8019 RepID=UPI0012DBE0B4|nr:rho GTPase-activating protein 30-like isoform X2 [Oncorhynchus kisutch]